MGCGTSTLKGYENRDDLNPRPIHQAEVSTKSAWPQFDNSGSPNHQSTTYPSYSVGQDLEPHKKKEAYHDYQNQEEAQPMKQKEIGEAGPKEKTKKELKAEANASFAAREKARTGNEGRTSYVNPADYVWGYN